MKLTKKIRLLDETLPNSAPRIFDEVSGILYWDEHKKVYYEINKEMKGNFWIPDEVSMAQDIQHWNSKMTENDKQLYLDGMGVLASLDSIATEFDKTAADYIRNPAIKANMAFIGGMESIHNESYTYNLSSVVTKPVAKKVFEFPKTNKLLVERNRLIMDVFGEFLKDQTLGNFVRSIVSMSGLEGLCFVNGFTPFYHLNRNNKMFGTGTIIQYIQRDEAQHTYFQTVLVRDIMEQYPEENTEEFSDFVYSFFTHLVHLEKAFCEDLYKNTPDIDIEEVKDYIEYRANTILDDLGLDKIFKTKKNPMAWITAFDPDNLNNTKRDFFEDKEINYVKPSETDNGWDEL
jgi:ribonucleoside-diphosphate reductase beta chain